MTRCQDQKANAAAVLRSPAGYPHLTVVSNWRAESCVQVGGKPEHETGVLAGPEKWGKMLKFDPCKKGVGDARS
jgi:hypothetical protein